MQPAGDRRKRPFMLTDKPPKTAVFLKCKNCGTVPTYIFCRHCRFRHNMRAGRADKSAKNNLPAYIAFYISLLYNLRDKNSIFGNCSAPTVILPGENLVPAMAEAGINGRTVFFCKGLLLGPSPKFSDTVGRCRIRINNESIELDCVGDLCARTKQCKAQTCYIISNNYIGLSVCDNSGQFVAYVALCHARR